MPEETKLETSFESELIDRDLGLIKCTCMRCGFFQSAYFDDSSLERWKHDHQCPAGAVAA